MSGRLLGSLRSVFLIGMSWFLVWSLAVAFAQSEVQVDIFRALQGAGMSAAIVRMMCTARSSKRKLH